MGGPVILLLGRCGLHRLVDPLRARGHEVAVGAWSEVELVQRLAPALVYVDLYEWTLLTPLVAAALGGPPPGAEHAAAVAARRAVVEALAGAPALYRGLRPPAWGTLAPVPDALRAGLRELSALVEGQPALDVAGLWARHGVLDDGVRFGPGHGEAELGPLGSSRLDGRSAAALEADAVHAAWRARGAGPRKCVVVDLDDTLIYGRIADEDYTSRNPAWDPAGQGDPELAWWRAPRGTHLALRELARRGALLALATRNEPALVRARLRRRPLPPGPVGGALAMLLEHDDFVAVEAGFGPKSGMLRRIALRLGLAPEQLLLVDDSPVERAEVEANLPAVATVDGGVLHAAWRLLDHPELAVVAPSPAAATRRASYRSRAAVTETPLEQLHAFLRGLELEVEVRPAVSDDLPRVRELFQRTNQLALTSARPQPTAVDGLLVATARDRLADHGLVAAGLFGGQGDDRRLLAYACSCRVLPHRIAATVLWAMRQAEPTAEAHREDTGRNAASRGLLEEAATGPAPWVRLRRSGSAD